MNQTNENSTLEMNLNEEHLKNMQWTASISDDALPFIMPDFYPMQITKNSQIKSNQNLGMWMLRDLIKRTGIL